MAKRAQKSHIHYNSSTSCQVRRQADLGEADTRKGKTGDGRLTQCPYKSIESSSALRLAGDAQHTAADTQAYCIIMPT